MRVGVDVGGTFTDVVLVDGAQAGVWTVKVPTTPEDPVVGALQGIAEILRRCGADPQKIQFVGHGTTIATNLIVEGKGARTALITTKGFRDVLEIRRAGRHDRADLYDLFFVNPEPLAPRRRRFEVVERIRYDGSIEEPLDRNSLAAAIEAVKLSGAQAVAVCFLHSYRNADHETAAIAFVRERLPDLFATASIEVNPEIYEYERTSTTVINAALGPRCGGYIRGFRDRLRATGVKADLQFMQSNGGLAAPAVTAALPVTMLQSGPAGGVTAAAKLCRRLNLPFAITGDMGGTTFDVSVVRDFQPEQRMSSLVATRAVRAPTIDIESIGAGGGSIAWIDAGGGLNVGPESAGADPGPACYGRGGMRPTVTDCNLLLGYVDPNTFLGGGFKLDADAARRAVGECLAQPLNMDVLDAARAVRSLANANMAQAMRLMTVERGYDPRDMAFVAFGGGGPVHAIDLAESLGVPAVVAPQMPGLFSALGMLVADQVYDAQAALLANLRHLDHTELIEKFSAIEEALRARLKNSGAYCDQLVLNRLIDCRYVGQAEGLTIEVEHDAAELPSELRRAFESAHQRQWHFVQPDRDIEVLNLRVRAMIEGAQMPRQAAASRSGDKPSQVGERRIVFPTGACIVPVYDRSTLIPGDALDGPCLIQEDSSCLIVNAGWRAKTDVTLALLVTRT